MDKLMAWLQGKKTYLVGLSIILTGALAALDQNAAGQPIDWNAFVHALQEGFGLIFLRAGVSKVVK